MVVFHVADDVVHRGVFIQLRFLFDRGHAQPRAAGDVAIVGDGAAVKQPQQRRLAGAVAADEANALAGLDGEVGVIQQRVVPIGELDVGKSDEGSEGHVVCLFCGVQVDQGVLSQEPWRLVGRTPRGSWGQCRDL
ncbi:hypothetical protein D3C73_789790 [compost metagenome]